MSFKKIPIPVLESLLNNPLVSEKDKEEIRSILPSKHLTPNNWRETQKEALDWNEKQKNSNPAY
jgi:hypothetical protein